MDAYTAETRDWLESRYERTSPDGVYLAHQPIYGFRAGHCEPWLLERYVRTLAIIRALGSLRWESCLDVGAAEGYKAALARQLFGGRVVASDLAESACRRAREIYDLEAQPADVHDLPFADHEFDVVLCSETLEHVTDVRAATLELDRVARRALVITVPNDPAEEVERNAAAGVAHGHVHKFSADSFDFLRERGYQVEVRPLVNPLMRLASGLIEAERKWAPPGRGARSTKVAAFNAVLPVTSRLFGARAERVLIAADGVACRLLPPRGAYLFTVIKDAAARCPTRRRTTAQDMLSFTVPLHRPEIGERSP
jgi:SAM-dependent methyltransferase